MVSSAALPFGKYLASTEKKTRDKAIKDLTLFLSDSSQNAISELEAAKLWKGIFYCFWMSDKPLVQQALASELADITIAISTTSSSLLFLRGFWRSIVREWNGIDRLRIDKYYMLVRRFVKAAFRLLMRAGWDKGVLRDYNDILTSQGGPLCPTDIKVPTGLAYHISDIYLEELDNALGSHSPNASSSLPAPLSMILEPFLYLSALTPSSVTCKRIQSALFEPLFSALSAPPRNDDGSQLKQRGHIADDSASFSYIPVNGCMEDAREEGRVEAAILKKRLLRKLFDVASQPETRDSNRRKMYALFQRSEDDGDSD